MPNLSNYKTYILKQGLPRRLSGKESACQCRRYGFDHEVGKMPWRRECQPTAVFLPGESRGQRSLAGYSPCGPKESDTTEQLTLPLSFNTVHGPDSAALIYCKNNHVLRLHLFSWQASLFFASPMPVCVSFISLVLITFIQSVLCSFLSLSPECEC